LLASLAGRYGVLDCHSGVFPFLPGCLTHAERFSALSGGPHPRSGHGTTFFLTSKDRGVSRDDYSLPSVFLRAAAIRFCSLSPPSTYAPQRPLFPWYFFLRCCLYNSRKNLLCVFEEIPLPPDSSSPPVEDTYFATSSRRCRGLSFNVSFSAVLRPCPFLTRCC